jgi:hypothetical protein
LLVQGGMTAPLILLTTQPIWLWLHSGDRLLSEP